MGGGAVIPRAFLAWAIEVIVARDAQRGGGGDERVADLVALKVRDL
jgi:hypothetical protein